MPIVPSSEGTEKREVMVVGAVYAKKNKGQFIVYQKERHGVLLFGFCTLPSRSWSVFHVWSKLFLGGGWAVGGGNRIFKFATQVFSLCACPIWFYPLLSAQIFGFVRTWTGMNSHRGGGKNKFGGGDVFFVQSRHLSFQSVKRLSRKF